MENNCELLRQQIQAIRVINFPVLKMARSGPIRNRKDFDAFDNWWSSIDMKHYITPRDFLWHNQRLDYMEWFFAIPEGLSDTNGYEVFDFPGGLYAVGTTKNEEEDRNRLTRFVKEWVDNSGCFELSTSRNDPHERYVMTHVSTPKIFKEKLGYHLTDMFFPIVLKER